MNRIDTLSSNNGKFVPRNPSTGTPGTKISAEWLNGIQEEIVNVISASGVTLNKNDNTQLKAAILFFIKSEILKIKEAAITEDRVIELINQHALTWE